MDAYSVLEDHPLLQLLQAGDERAFHAIYTRYSLLLFRYAQPRCRNREDSEEILHDVFLKLWERRATLTHVTDLKAYLYAAVRYKVADYIAHHRIRTEYAALYLKTERPYENPTEALMDVADINATLTRVLADLPANCQTAFKLSRFEHLPIADIAERMKLSTRTVENYISQALAHLRGKLIR